MEELNLREVYNYFKTKIILMVIIMVIVLTAGNIYSAVKTPMYSSHSKIILVSDKKNHYDSGDIQLNKDLVGTYSDILKSRKVLNKVIEHLKLKISYESLYSSIIVSGVGDKEIITLQVNNVKAKDAQKIANEVLKVFVKEVDKIYNLDNITIIDEPTLEEVPYNKNYFKDNLIYVMIGVVLSCGVVFLLFYFDTTIKSADVIEEKFGLTVLGSIPMESNKE